MKLVYILTFSLIHLPQLAEELGFVEALRQMTEATLDLRTQKAKAAIAANEITAARGSFSPKLDLVGEQSNAGGNSPRIQGESAYAMQKSYAAVATWNLFRSGSDWATFEATRNERKAEDLNYEDK